MDTFKIWQDICVNLVLIFFQRGVRSGRLFISYPTITWYHVMDQGAGSQEWIRKDKGRSLAEAALQEGKT